MTYSRIVQLFFLVRSHYYDEEIRGSSSDKPGTEMRKETSHNNLNISIFFVPWNNILYQLIPTWSITSGTKYIRQMTGRSNAAKVMLARFQESR